jgi:hypothetical protein
MKTRRTNIPPINYTSRDFGTIKEDLVSYAKRYYPDTFQDFSEASFGSLMLDMTAYVGDVVSFYLDYQVNESFLDSAVENQNINRLARQMGYRQSGTSVSEGIVTVYIIVPASSTGISPDLRYAPVLRNGTKFTSSSGVTFTLIEDIDFGNSENETITAAVNATTTLPTSYAIKARGRIRSGELKVEYFSVGEYVRYPKFTLADNFITEIVDVFDSAGNRYFEVDYLSQDTVYSPIINRGNDSNNVPYIMKPKVVPRRFVTEFQGNRTTIQFGHGSEENLTSDVVSDPYNVVLDMHGKNYVTDKSFDPTNLIETDSLGVAPSNTTLTVIYRSNNSQNVNISANSLESLADVDIRFKNANTLQDSTIRNAISSLEYENEEPIVGNVNAIGAEEIRQRAYGLYAAQNRAVTKEDYKAIIYKMPSKFGAIKKCNLVQDKDSFKRNLNLYVVSENSNGDLITTPQTLKNNLKTWISNYKMINDTVDILDGKIVNIGIEYEIMVDSEENRFSALDLANRVLANRFSRKFDFGEPLMFSDILQALKNIPNVLDVGEVRIVKRSGSQYSSIDFNIQRYTSADGRSIMPPEDFIFEIKIPSSDIRGTVI